MTENPYGLPLIADPEQDAIQLENQLDLYEKGRKLRKFVLDPDWEIVIQVLQDYRDKYRDALVSLLPGTRKYLWPTQQPRPRMTSSSISRRASTTRWISRTSHPRN